MWQVSGFRTVSPVYNHFWVSINEWALWQYGLWNFQTRYKKCFRHPSIVYWKDSPKKVFFAKDFAVTNKALVLQCFVAVRTFQALWVPIVVQDFQDKSVKNEKTTTCALRYSCCNKWTVIHKLCDLLWNSLKDTISSSAAFLVLPNKVA